MPVAWSAKRQSVRATSTCESEYVAIYDTIKLAKSQGYYAFFMEENQLPLIFVDNRSAIDLSKTSVVSKKSKHISLRYHAVGEHCRDLCYLPTDLNRADPLTKPLVSDKYVSLFCAYQDDREDDDDFHARSYMCEHWAVPVEQKVEKPTQSSFVQKRQSEPIKFGSLVLKRKK